MQNIDREPLFFTQFPNKKSVQFSINFCFRDCLDEILIKLEEIFIKSFKYSN